MTEREGDVAENIELALPNPEPVQSCCVLRQGDVVTVEHVSVICEENHAFATPYGAAIISQTCDIVLDNRPNVQVAAIVMIQGDAARKARDKAQSRYVELPFYHADAFIDLEYVSTLEKQHLAGLKFTQGIDPKDLREVRRVGLALGRRFSRFPFPDEVNPWLRPLISEIRKKFDRVASPVGRALQEVVEMRVEAKDWSLRPLELTVHVIVKAGSIPEFDPEGIESVARPEIVELLTAEPVFRKTPPQVAEFLFPDEPKSRVAVNGFEQNLLWDALAQAFAKTCKPSGKDALDPLVVGAVKNVEGMLWSDDEFPLSRYRRSELLDVDNLSGRTPLLD